MAGDGGQGEVRVQVLEAVKQPAPSVTAAVPLFAAADVEKLYDVFLSHASEDKGSFVEPLAQLLQRRGVRVWYDRFVLRPGESLSGKIDDGFARSNFGVLVVSKSFIAKRWPDSEYRALVALERHSIPVWHNVDRDDDAK